MDSKWQEELHAFFDIRSGELNGTALTEEQLCYVSGRDPRLWKDPNLYADMMASIERQLQIGKMDSLLEVGCATGFLARGLSSIAGQYTGVDLSKNAIREASRLRLKSAVFRQANGASLPFPDGFFDRSICYDVITNFPSFTSFQPIILEMLRVTRPRGKVMIGSVPDKGTKEEFLSQVQRVGATLNEKFGCVQLPPVQRRPLIALRKWYLRNIKKIEPKIICYYFWKKDFIALGSDSGIKTEILGIHEKNPYFGYRFNVVYTKQP